MGEMQVGVEEIFYYAAATLSDSNLRSLTARLESVLLQRNRSAEPHCAEAFTVTPDAEAVSEVVS